jgi:hypothetical protein
MFAIGQSVCPWQIFIALLFVSKAGAYPIEAPKVAPLEGGLLALPTNISLGWRGFSGTNTLAYYEHFVNYRHKTFYNIGPRPYLELAEQKVL